MINKNRAGIYIAFPTTDVLKPIYRQLKTQVNCNHTKVGITVKSFLSREREYMGTFDGEVEFIPIAEIPVEQLKMLEQVILTRICAKYQRVGYAREWFDTNDREQIVAIIQEVLANRSE